MSASPRVGTCGMTSSEQRQFFEIFRLVDRNNSGTITKDELGSLFHMLRTPVSPAELDLLMNELDANDDGEIDFPEFCEVMTLRVAAKHTADEVRQAFKSLAAPGDSASGLIDLRIIEFALNSSALFRAPNGASSVEIAEANERTRVALDILGQLPVDYLGKFNFEAFIANAMVEK